MACRPVPSDWVPTIAHLVRGLYTAHSDFDPERTITHLQTPSRVLQLICCTALVICAATNRAAAVGQAPPLIHDQHGEVLQFDHAEPFVVIVVSKRRLRRLKPWEAALKERFGPDLDIVRIAHAAQETGERVAPDTDRLARALKRRVPAEVSIGLDLTGWWASHHGLDTQIPAVLVMSGQGSPPIVFQGNYTQARLADVVAAVEDLGIVKPDRHTRADVSN